MVEDIKIVVHANPYPKGRSRVSMRGKFPVVYTPKKTRDAEGYFLSQAIKQKPEKPLEGALSVKISFFRIKPSNYSSKIIYWAQKPDLDNLVKLVLDALNKVFYLDDSQVVELTCTKGFTKYISRTEVVIRSLEDGR